MTRRAIRLVLLLTAASRLDGLQGQSTSSPVILSTPEAALPDAFSAVRGVRELPSGRVLVADWIEERVVSVDMASGAMDETVSVGPGPDEARLPAGLVPLGDSTLLLDRGNQRLSVMGPDGRIHRTIRADRPGMVGVKGVDERGGFYYAVPAWASPGGALSDDSVEVVRWSPGTGERRTVAVVQGTRARRDRSPSREMRLPVVGFAAHDGWTVLSDGTLVTVRAGGYRVEVRSPEGALTRGPSYAYPPRKVTDDDKRAFIESFLASSPMSGRGADGGIGHAPSADET